MVIRNGEAYTSRFDQNREVWLGGERVRNLTSHPHFMDPVQTVARVYDLQARHQSSMYCLDDLAIGKTYPSSLSWPRSSAAFRRRGDAYRVVADATHGLMGRSPDFVNTLIAAMASAKQFFSEVDPRYGENILNYLDFCRENDLFVAHASVNPSSDKSAGSGASTNRTTHLQVVGKSADGIVVRGAKMIATLAPLADELLVFPMPGYSPGDEQFVAAFAIPIATAGLRIICREPFGGPGRREPFDFPLHQFDEMDATIVFDDVMVPWERVFLTDSVDHANRLYPETTAQHHTSHQGVIRGLAKMELMCAVTVRLAESVGAKKQLHVQEMVGEALGLLEIYRGAVARVEATATRSKWGIVTPVTETIRAIRLHFPKACNRIMEIIYALGGGSLVATPTYSDICAEGSPDVERYFTVSSGESPLDRVALLKLAWNLTGDSFGQRQSLYERNLAGDPVRLAASLYRDYPMESLYPIVENVIGRERVL